MNDSPYSLPQIYELAFSFRDYPKAVDFLIAASEAAGLPKIGAMVELGCGPGQYCREFARRGTASFGVDLSDDMVAYTRQCCRDENLPCEIIEADMRAFGLPAPVDLAVCMMATFHLMLTNDDIVAHLNAVADNLTPGGLYIAELSHPKDIYRPESCADNRWTMEDNYCSVTTDWASDSILDPITEVRNGTVTFKIKHPTRTETHSFSESWREISVGLIHALVELSGRFRIVATYGDLDLNVPFDTDKKAWRMVLILQKK